MTAASASPPPSSSSAPNLTGRRQIGWLSLAAAVVALFVALPILSVATNVFSSGTGDTWTHLVSTVLPEYITTTLWLCVGVGSLAALVGVGTAWLVTHFDFPLRLSFEWALVLPLAMPAYVMAYAYTDLLQFAGPLQSWLRATMGWTRADYSFPDVRTLGGAVVMFTFVLYPYVFMLARSAFMERGVAVMEAGRSLGLSPWQSFLRISLPMARPAVAAGMALVLMETLADYGTVSYFAVQTFTTGIYRAWFSLGDRVAAAQLAMCLLGFVVLLLALERQSRGTARFHGSGLRRQPTRGTPLTGLEAAVAVALCALPILIGFVLPGGVLLHMARGAVVCRVAHHAEALIPQGRLERAQHGVARLVLVQRRHQHAHHAPLQRQQHALHARGVERGHVRLVRLGEQPSVPRISDLGHLATSSLGKLELDLMGSHQMTERQVLEAVVAEAIATVFEEYVEEHGLAEIAVAFRQGAKVEVGDMVPSAAYEAIVADVPAVWQKAFEVNAARDPAVRASCIEFVLAGLYATERISRLQSHGRTVYDTGGFR
jgi:ABC-type sulfate transport system permease component